MKKNMMTYNAKDIEEILGIPTRRIQFYVESGLVSADNPGRGRHGRTFNRDNLLELAIVNKLSRLGIELSVIKWIFERIHLRYPMLLKSNTYESADPPGFFLQIFNGGEFIKFGGEREMIVDDNGRYVGGAAKKITVDLSEYDSALVVNISKVYQKIR